MLDHVLRRMGFGASSKELDTFSRLPLVAVVGYLMNYDRAPDDVDAKINDAAYVGVTTRGAFSPNTVINDTRQRWLFRMIHTQRPLQEKMARFWHGRLAASCRNFADGRRFRPSAMLLRGFLRIASVGESSQVSTSGASTISKAAIPL